MYPLIQEGSGSGSPKINESDRIRIGILIPDKNEELYTLLYLHVKAVTQWAWVPGAYPWGSATRTSENTIRSQLGVYSSVAAPDWLYPDPDPQNLMNDPDPVRIQVNKTPNWFQNIF